MPHIAQTAQTQTQRSNRHKPCEDNQVPLQASDFLFQSEEVTVPQPEIMAGIHKHYRSKIQPPRRRGKGHSTIISNYYCGCYRYKRIINNKRAVLETEAETTATSGA